MKSIITVCLVAVATACLAQPEVLPALTCSGITTSTVPVTAVTAKDTAYIKGLQIAVSPAGTTCTVAIATGGSGGLSARTLYSSEAAAGTVFIRPVAEVCTNGVAVSDFTEEFIANDYLSVSAHTATEVTNITVTVTPVIDRKR